jgi:hypothetical protein
VDARGRPLDADGAPFLASRASDEADAVAVPRPQGAPAYRERQSTAREVALRLKAAGERQRRALELQAEAINELAAALDEQGEAIAQLLLPDTVAELDAGSVRPT